MATPKAAENGPPDAARPADAIEDVFIRRWGDMGTVWGINRTMAEVQGLLYITGATLCTDDVMERLGISRGSANMALRSLLDWGVVRKVHKRGDRRDYYESLSDVWQIFAQVAQHRKAKEIDPIVTTLLDCERRLAGGPVADATPAVVRDRLTAMLAFLGTMESLAGRFLSDEDSLARAVGLLSDAGHPSKGDSSPR